MSSRPTTGVTESPILEAGSHTRAKLGTLTCMSLITNKMIGTGIFSIPSTIFQYANGNVGLLFSLFLMGSVIIFCGFVIYLEYALNLPVKNGGEKNYLLRVFRDPKGLMGCVYSFQIVLLGFSSGNSYAFGKYLLYAITNKEEQSELLVKILGVACITFCILLHSKYPNQGTFLFNFLGIFKILILVLIIFVGALVSLNLIEYEKSDNFKHLWKYDREEKPSTYSIAVALLEIIYSFKGWENANYVLSEVSNPYKMLTIAAPLAVLATTLLYFLVIGAYLIVIPKDEMLNSGVLVAGIFFRKIFGASASSRVLPVLISLSNLGNVLVVSFAHSHVNKELADNNYIPFSKAFHNFNLSLLLHWFVTVVILVAPPSNEVYEFVVNLYVYPGTWINILITSGLIYLKLNAKEEKWGEFNDTEFLQQGIVGSSQNADEESSEFDEESSLLQPTIRTSHTKPNVQERVRMKRLSTPIVCIAIFLIANMFLAIFPFVPPPPLEHPSFIPYWCFPVLGTSSLLIGVVFFFTRAWWTQWIYRTYGSGNPHVKYEEEYKNSLE